MKGVKKDFPILRRKVHGKPLVYLDNAATTQKPVQVINAIKIYYESHNANIHRGVHKLSEEATEAHESARKKTADFIGAQQKEIVFTRNATEAINIVAYSMNVKKGDNIVSTIMEHHSNLVPWQMLREKGVEVRFVDIDEKGKLDTEDLKNKINNKTRIVAVTHASNVLGTINDIKKLSKIAHENGALILVDGAQGAPHMPVDVKKMDVDFYAFSGHKMLGPMGIGVLYGKKDLLDKMPPFLRGGDMIKEVELERTAFNDVPAKFEAGTPDVAGAVGLGAAIDYLQRLGMKNIRRHEVALTKYALDDLSDIKGLTIYGPKNAKEKSGVVSFTLDGVHPHDIGTILDEEGIAVRTGHACTMPLMKRLGCGSIARASFYIYNTNDEIDKLKSGLEKVKKIFRV